MKYTLLNHNGTLTLTDKPQESPGQVLDTIHAESWLHAKRDLGFELTELQAKLVDRSMEEREVLLHFEKFFGQGAR